MPRLIVNADDFGLHPAVNQGIVRGHLDGCITSASLMPGAAAFEDALALAGDCPDLGLGVHLTLVGAKPVCDPAKVPSLVDKAGTFPEKYPAFMARFFRGAVALRDIRTEFEAQIARTVAYGVSVTHLDSHQHLHVLPGVVDIVLDLAQSHGIRAIRIPAEAPFFTGDYPAQAGRLVSRFGLSCLAELARRKARRQGLTVPDRFYGMLAGGNLRQEYLLRIIEQVSDGCSEIMTHPGMDNSVLGAIYGWGYHWADELAALTDREVKKRISDKGIRLISFRELGDEQVS